MNPYEAGEIYNDGQPLTRDQLIEARRRVLVRYADYQVESHRAEQAGNRAVAITWQRLINEHHAAAAELQQAINRADDR